MMFLRTWSYHLFSFLQTDTIKKDTPVIMLGLISIPKFLKFGPNAKPQVQTSTAYQQVVRMMPQSFATIAALACISVWNVLNRPITIKACSINHKCVRYSVFPWLISIQFFNFFSVAIGHRSNEQFNMDHG